ncbi:MAG: universal stress protein [Aeromicrobium sp.]
MHTNHFPVLVGVADKQPAALSYAIAEAERLRRPMRVVHCWAPPAVMPEDYLGVETPEAARADAERVLEEARSAILRAAPLLEAEFVTVEGAPASSLAREATRAAVLVLGSDDVSSLDRLLGGAVSGFLARTAACPVVVVPDRDVPDSGDGGVVVTIDGDTSASGPLRYAFEQAEARREPLHVLHAAPEATLRADFLKHQANVAEVVAGWQTQYPDVAVLRCTSEGTPAEECIEATSEASLVVIGRHHGHSTPFARARPIAMRVLRDAQCPVAVVPLDYGRSDSTTR